MAIKRKYKIRNVVYYFVLIIVALVSFTIGYSLNKKEYVFIEKRRVPNPIVNYIPEKEEILTTSYVQNENLQSDLIYLGEFKLTGYCDCIQCQEEWVGTTALGVAPTTNWTIAVDPDIIPLGSIVVIDGREYRAEDVGGAIQENRIDMFMESHEACYQDICNGYRDVYLKN